MILDTRSYVYRNRLEGMACSSLMEHKPIVCEKTLG